MTSALAVATPNPLAPIAETSASAVAAQAKAAIEARYLMAMHRPRLWLDVRSRLLDACKRPGFAELARYAKPIGGGKKVEGPSIRFAEEAIRSMTNVLTDSIVVFDDDERRIVRVSVTDLEANVSFNQDVILEKTVERRSPRQGDEVISSRMNSTGQVVTRIRATEDDLLVKQNAHISKAIRNGVDRILPADIREEAMATVIATVREGDKRDPLAARKRVADSFYSMGISVADIEKFLGHPMEQINEAELGLLRTIYTAIREGEATWADAMAEKEERASGNGKAESKGTDALRAQLEKKKSGASAQESAPAAKTREPGED